MELEVAECITTTTKKKKDKLRGNQPSCLYKMITPFVSFRCNFGKINTYSLDNESQLL